MGNLNFQDIPMKHFLPGNFHYGDKEAAYKDNVRPLKSLKKKDGEQKEKFAKEMEEFMMGEF